MNDSAASITSPAALAGLRVLELASLILGPYCGQQSVTLNLNDP